MKTMEIFSSLCYDKSRLTLKNNNPRKILIETKTKMALDKTNKYGGIKISLEAIAGVAGSAALECYGVVGLARKYGSGEEVSEPLSEDKYHRGIFPFKDKERYGVNIYIIVAYGVKITEVVSEVQKKVKFVLEKTFEIPFKAVNVFVQALK